VHVYVLPALSPVTVSGADFPDLDFVAPPFVDVHVAVYFVIAAPLLLAAAKETLTDPRPAFVTVNAVAAAGAPIVTADVITDAGPATTPFSAATVNVYVWPRISPLITVVVPGPGTNVGLCATPLRYGVTM